MKLVVDTNILFTFFWENSFSRNILLDESMEFFPPELALKEINKYQDEIREKTGISLEKFKELREDLAICVKFIPLEQYSEFLDKASEIPDKDDVDFVALALKLDLPVWSNDPHFKEQSLVEVFKTEELVEELET